MKIERLEPIVATLKGSNHPYLSGPWTPQHEEVNAFDLEVIEGAIPTDIDGVYIRNTENQVHTPLGRYHPFDGDGMLHQISFQNGKADYRNRFVRTRCFQAEQQAGASLWGGMMDPAGVSTRPGFGAHGGLKDSASTDVVVHKGKAIATFYQCGEAYQLDATSMEDQGVAPWGPLDGVSAHCRVDERTGELLFFNYSKHAPYMYYGIVDADGRRTHYTPIPLPGARLPHDMIFSENYTILNDFPMYWDEKAMKAGFHAVRFNPQMKSRFAIIPRYGTEKDIMWFEAEPTYVLHFLNAYEQGDEIIMDGYFQDNPMPKPLADLPEAWAEYAHMMAFVDEQSFQPKLHRWRFNLKTGETIEERLDDRVVEFGTVNQQYAGQPYRYAYSTTTKPGWFLFNGFIKHDLETGESWTVNLPDGRYASEAPFAPRINGTSEDDGYLVSFIIDENAGTSECILIDCKKFGEGPVCRIRLPHKISSGTHACWADRRFVEA